VNKNELDTRLYDEDETRIAWIVYQLYEQWHDRPNTKENLFEYKRQLEGRLADAGYVVDANVDVIPAQVVVHGKIDSDPDFDHEKKRHEILTSKSQGGR
jgi:hypothetical protein